MHQQFPVQQIPLAISQIPFRVWLVLMVTLPGTLAVADDAHAEEAVIFEDQFNEKLGDGWTWMQQNGTDASA